MNAPQRQPSEISTLNLIKFHQFCEEAEDLLQDIYNLSVYKEKEDVAPENLQRYLFRQWNAIEKLGKNYFEAGPTRANLPEDLSKTFEVCGAFFFAPPKVFVAQVEDKEFYWPERDPENKDFKEFCFAKDRRGTNEILNHFGMLAIQFLSLLKEQKTLFPPAPEVETELLAEPVQSEKEVIREKAAVTIEKPEAARKIAVVSKRVSNDLEEIQAILLEDLAEGVKMKDKKACLEALRYIVEETGNVSISFSPEDFEDLLRRRYDVLNVQAYIEKMETGSREKFLKGANLDYAFWSFEIPIFNKGLTEKRKDIIRKGLAKGRSLAFCEDSVSSIQWEAGVFLTEKGVDQLEAFEDKQFFLVAGAIAKYFKN